jgi:hypothetical protein
LPTLLSTSSRTTQFPVAQPVRPHPVDDIGQGILREGVMVPHATAGDTLRRVRVEVPILARALDEVVERRDIASGALRECALSRTIMNT